MTQTLHEIVMQLNAEEGLTPDALWALKHLAEMKGDELAAAQKWVKVLEAERAEIAKAYAHKMYMAGAVNDNEGASAVVDEANRADDAFFALMVKLIKSVPASAGEGGA
jgi:hypothetical protein